MTPYEIHHEVMEAGGHIDVVSVYRILNAFKPIGLVHHIGAVDGYWACSMVHEGVSHSCHLVCRTCRRVVEVKQEDDLVASSIKKAEAEGFGPPLVQLEIISDSCDKCNGVKPEGR
jgi:Fe2+ or Zn2+ uptake regulation protein